jgi:hypothetical protein
MSVEVPNSEQLDRHGPEEWSRRALRATRQALTEQRCDL